MARAKRAARPYGEQLVPGAAVISGSVTHYLGLLSAARGRHEKAEEHVATAAVTHERLARWAPRGWTVPDSSGPECCSSPAFR
ncbi:MAG: hypothetical protein M3O70_27495 [Actinomycetota bacterium]|nr:hypothetical protein [Actinomycetota bacterium]